MRYELRKLFCRKETWVLLLITAVLCAALLMRGDVTAMSDAERRAIRDYPMIYTEAEPLISAELADANLEPARAEALSRILQSAAACREQVQNQRDFLAILRELQSTESTPYATLEQQKAYDAYNRAYPMRLFPREQLGYGLLQMEDEVPSYIFALLMIALFSRYFCMERESKMHLVLYPSLKSKYAIFDQKCAAAAVTATLLALTMTFLTAMGVFLRRGIPLSLMTEPLQSAGMFSRCPFAFTILEYLLLLAALRALAGMFVFAVAAIASAFLRHSGGVFCVTAAAATLAGLAHHVTLRERLLQWDSVNVLGVPVQRLPVCAAVWISLTCLLLLTAKICYTKGMKHGC